jgi:hypothetical protein
MVCLDQIFKYLQYLSLIEMFHKVFPLSLYITSSKIKDVDYTNAIENACSNEPKSAIASSNSTKNPKAKVNIACCDADKKIP